MKLPFDLRALWDRALTWYRGHGERDRRIILGVLGAVGFSLVYVGVIEPILDYRKDVAAQIDSDQAKLEKSTKVVGTKDSLKVERDDLRKRLAQAKTRLLPGGTVTLGAAALQERTNSLAKEKGISVQSTQVMKEAEAEPFKKVSVRLTLSGELNPLAEFVSGVEYAQQLAIPFIEISRRGAVAGAKGPRTLSVTVEVSGFVQGGVGKPDGAEGEGAPAEGAGETPGADGQAPAGAVEATAGGPGDGAAPPGAPAADGAPAPAAAPPPAADGQPAGEKVPATPGATTPPGVTAPATVPPPITGITFPPMVPGGTPSPAVPPAPPAGVPPLPAAVPPPPAIVPKAATPPPTTEPLATAPPKPIGPEPGQPSDEDGD